MARGHRPAPPELASALPPDGQDLDRFGEHLAFHHALPLGRRGRCIEDPSDDIHSLDDASEHCEAEIVGGLVRFSSPALAP